MKLDDVLSKTKLARTRASDMVYEMLGAVEPDFDDRYFRLYPDPADPLHYFLIDKKDVEEEVYELTADEAIQAGFTGRRLYKLSVKHGTTVMHYSVSIERVGETVAASAGREVANVRGCRSAPSCPSPHCCTSSGGRCRCSTCCIA